ncbi:hypothetical protein MPTK1_1g22600 [Marchantia polymorpha subsp. ruderalis]|uniref:Uncharacterized protein n=2 Tax=Marchantia polymorpha TaxID=3197 RepID=A0A176WTD0_MARPO|nr:hypothetical protein AXG93_2782s1160 [Marchantia polymorpha subsp. ruderalis]PTQ30891.1 hypothetical protein MARPO_0118s0027 [Marchantia polymorpha]BBM99634.1 hypothetical protein Mp_1g22600 [Marchantia polymorpha subsp. ruderalis]|eukprot:PTQ30891.1 hypothetical protein MARPO_0118s0027 [Marchantia polymorpha]
MAPLHRRLWQCSSLLRETAGCSRLESSLDVLQKAPRDHSSTSSSSRVSGFNFLSSFRMLPSRDSRAHVPHCVTAFDCQGFKELAWPFLRQSSEKWLSIHHHPREQAVMIMRASGLTHLRPRPDVHVNQQAQPPGAAPPTSITSIQTTCTMANGTEVPAHTYTIPAEAEADDGDAMKPRILAVQKVKPAMSGLDEYLPLSNLDRLLSSMYPQTFFVFESTRWRSVENVVSALKRTLADVLVHYYPFAGEMKDPEWGVYKIHCNGAGADFTEAFVDACIKDLDFVFPSPSFAYNFLPTPNVAAHVLCPLSIKVTRFRCGGLLLGFSFHHQVADFQSYLMFLQAWTQAMRGQAVTALPEHGRGLLRARPRERPCRNHELEYRVQQRDEERMPRPTTPRGAGPVVSKCFHLSSGTIEALKRMATGDGRFGPFSATVCATAFFWRLIMRANGYRAEQVAKMACSIDGRKRMLEPRLPDNFFGNVIGLSVSAAPVWRLETEPLSFAARLIHDNIQRAMSSDHFRSLIDWVEAQKPLPVNPNFNIFSDPVMICSSLINAPLYDLDFGLGRRPDFVGYGAMPDGVHNVLWLQPSPFGRGNILAQVHLHADALSRLERDSEFDLVASSDCLHSLAALGPSRGARCARA